MRYIKTTQGTIAVEDWALLSEDWERILDAELNGLCADIRREFKDYFRNLREGQ